MKFSPKTILILFFINILLALFCNYLMFPYRFTEDLEAFWQIPLAITIVSVIVLIISRMAEAGLANRAKKYKVYFIGQLTVTLLILSFYAWFEIRSADYRKNQANIDYNEKFVRDHTSPTRSDSIRLRALWQLEATSKDRNDLRLDSYHSEKRDTVLGNVHDSVVFIYFTYEHKEYPGISLCSKHMIGDKMEEMIYYNIPASEIEAVQKYIAEMDEKITEVIGYAMKDSLNKNEKKLLEDALKRIEKRKAALHR